MSPSHCDRIAVSLTRSAFGGAPAAGAGASFAAMSSFQLTVVPPWSDSDTSSRLHSTKQSGGRLDADVARIHRRARPGASNSVIGAQESNL